MALAAGIQGSDSEEERVRSTVRQGRRPGARSAEPYRTSTKIVPTAFGRVTVTAVSRGSKTAATFLTSFYLRRCPKIRMQRFTAGRDMARHCGVGAGLPYPRSVVVTQEGVDGVQNHAARMLSSPQSSASIVVGSESTHDAMGAFGPPRYRDRSYFDLRFLLYPKRAWHQTPRLSRPRGRQRRIICDDLRPYLAPTLRSIETSRLLG